jgi:hypothetical protein
MGDGGLGEGHVVLHVTGAHADAFADRALAFLLEQAQDPEPYGVGHGFEGKDEMFVGEGHTLTTINIVRRYVKRTPGIAEETLASSAHLISSKYERRNGNLLGQRA